jgi:hypothetical protein
MTYVAMCMQARVEVSRVGDGSVQPQLRDCRLVVGRGHLMMTSIQKHHSEHDQIKSTGSGEERALGREHWLLVEHFSIYSAILIHVHITTPT